MNAGGVSKKAASQQERDAAVWVEAEQIIEDGKFSKRKIAIFMKLMLNATTEWSETETMTMMRMES